MEKRLFERHEREIAELFPNASVTIASGAAFEKLDVQTARNETTWQPVIECKSTQAASFSVTQSLWDLIREKTYEKSIERRPVLAIRLYSKEGVVANCPILADLAVVDVNDLVELLYELERLRGEIQEKT